MEAGVVLLVLGLLLLSGSALAAFCWAARDGQFENLEEAPRIIFDHDEPPGRPDDCFPEPRSRAALARAAGESVP
jgi:cbb3-type cytochrome oxidase maturation protein